MTGPGSDNGGAAPGLFGDDAGRPAERAGLPAPTHGGARDGAGRKPGSLNRVNQDLRQYLVGVTGKEAILAQYRLAIVDVFDGAALDELAKLWRCDRLEVVDRVGAAFQRVARHVYPQLGSLEIRPAGAPDPSLGPLLDATASALHDGEARIVDIADLPLPVEEDEDDR